MLRPLAPLLLAIALCASAPAQTVLASGNTWTSAATGRSFNNPVSAGIDAALARSQQTQLLLGQMTLQATFDEQWRRVGRSVIERGDASVALPVLDRGMAGRVARLRLGGEADEAAVGALAEDLARDLDLVRLLGTERGVDLGDASNVLALAVVVGYERMRGEPTTAEQLAGVARDLRAGMLADPLVQGQGPAGLELTAARFASAIAGVERIAGAGDAAATRSAGASLLGALWADPLESVEAVDDGLVDRGRRIVRDGTGTTGYTPVLDEPALATAEAARVSFPDAVGFDADFRLVDRTEELRAAWIAERIEDAARFRREVQALGLPERDLAAAGAAAVALVWPRCDPDGAVPSRAAVQALFVTFRDDIAGDPAFQRMDDAARQRFFLDVAGRALDCVRRTDEVPAEVAVGGEAVEDLVAMMERDAARARVQAGRSAGRALLASMFWPRPLESVRLMPDAFVFDEGSGTDR